MGYLESWGRGIQKICDACKALGAEEPEYIVHGADIMVKFKALQSIETVKNEPAKIQNDALEVNSVDNVKEKADKKPIENK